MSVQDRIQSFLAFGPFAVVGASTDRSKYGNKVLRCYQQHGHEVYPINPKAPEVEGLKAYSSLAALPVKVPAISVITPPAATEQVVREAAANGRESLRIAVEPDLRGRDRSDSDSGKA